MLLCGIPALVLLGQVPDPLQVGWVGKVEGGVQPVSDGEGQVVLAELGEGRVQGCPSLELFGKAICLVLEPADELHHEELHQLMGGGGRGGGGHREGMVAVVAVPHLIVGYEDELKDEDEPDEGGP